MSVVELRQSIAPEVALYETGPLLERAVRHVLSDGKERTTAQLMAALWPILPDATSPHKQGRERMGRLLQTLAKSALRDCARRAGERTVRRMRGGRWMMQKQNPWLWKIGAGNEEAVKRCPHCNGEL